MALEPRRILSTVPGARAQGSVFLRVLRNRSAILMGAAAGGMVALVASLLWLRSLPDDEPEVPEVERLMLRAEMRRAADYGGIPDAAKWLRQALDLEPGNARAASALESAKSDAVQAVKDELAAGRPGAANALLQIYDVEWPRDRALSDLQIETSALFEEIAQMATLADILDRAQADIMERRLRSPKGENAWDKLEHAETLIREGDQGRRNWIDVSRRQIAAEYAKLVDQAIARDALDSAARHLASLETAVPDHPDLPRLRGRLDEEIRTAAMAEAKSTEPTVEIVPDPPEPAPLDTEDEFWAEVKRNYEASSGNCAVLARYSLEWPGGRFIDEYYTLKAECERAKNR